MAGNTGKPLDHQSSWIEETARQSDQRTRSLMINETREIQFGDFDRIHHALRRFLVDPTLPMGDRLAAAAALVRRLDTAAEKLDSAWLARMLQTAIAKGAATLAREARRFRHRSGGRLVLSLYLL